ncbi:MAG: 3-dehydroquinate synthase [Bacteroidales bacterium]|nr:3-dehydroquinate synthase [Bacteroidales bacterium]
MQSENLKSGLNPVNYWMGKDSLEKLQTLFEEFSKVFVLVDENTQKYCLPVLLEKAGTLDADRIISVPSGEEFKNLKTVSFIWEKLTEMAASRDSLLINLGGGVITDMGGFAAATFKRGMSFINIPTTLLGQVDAALGGKTGVDFQEFKNHIGTFTNPLAVVVDPVFLKTLDDLQWKSGFAEVLKYGFIMDKPLLDNIGNRSYQQIKDDSEMIIINSARDKIRVVEEDGLEKGLRKILNFGHTAGHALETWFLKSGNPITHGEAVAAGMICESWLSNQLTGLSDEDLKKVIDIIDRSFNRLSFPASVFEELLQLTRQDKKVRGNLSRFSLLKNCGESVFDVPVEDSLFVQSLEFYLGRQK